MIPLALTVLACAQDPHGGTAVGNPTSLDLAIAGESEVKVESAALAVAHATVDRCDAIVEGALAGETLGTEAPARELPASPRCGFDLFPAGGLLVRVRVAEASGTLDLPLTPILLRTGARQADAYDAYVLELGKPGWLDAQSVTAALNGEQDAIALLSARANAGAVLLRDLARDGVADADDEVVAAAEAPDLTADTGSAPANADAPTPEAANAPGRAPSTGKRNPNTDNNSAAGRSGSGNTGNGTSSGGSGSGSGGSGGGSSGGGSSGGGSSGGGSSGGGNRGDADTGAD